jgi:hypothetical protein
MKLECIEKIISQDCEALNKILEDENIEKDNRSDGSDGSDKRFIA